MIEIIPKPAPKTPLWQNILFYVSLSLLVISVICYFGLSHFQKKSFQTLKALDQEMAAKQTSEDKALEAEVISYKKKIGDFSVLLSQHQMASKFFGAFEKMVHPRVWFSDFNLDLEKCKVTVSGSTDSFWTLGQQLLIFKRQPLIKEVNLSGVSIGTEGDIRFAFNLLFSPKIFK